MDLPGVVGGCGAEQGGNGREAFKARARAWLGPGGDTRKLDKEEEQVSEDSDFSDASWKSAYAWKGLCWGLSSGLRA